MSPSSPFAFPKVLTLWWADPGGGGDSGSWNTDTGWAGWAEVGLGDWKQPSCWPRHHWVGRGHTEAASQLLVRPHRQPFLQPGHHPHLIQLPPAAPTRKE